jgi:hypothetical protein
MNGELKILKRGERIHISRNVVHSMWNSSGSKSVVNWRVVPALNTEYLLETTMGLANEGKTDNTGKPNLLQIALLMNTFSHVFRPAKPSYFVQRVVFSLMTPFAYLFGTGQFIAIIWTKSPVSLR